MDLTVIAALNLAEPLLVSPEIYSRCCANCLAAATSDR